MTDNRSSTPNILLFVVDQLTARALSAYGGSVCQTPALDQFVSRSILFENAYCNYPLCAPSRFSMLSGRLPSKIGAYDNGAEFTAATPTVTHYLRSMGYYTCLAGKMHFVGPDQFHGYEERLTTEIYPSDFSWTPPVTNTQQSTEQSNNSDPADAGVSTMDTVLDAGPMARTMQIDYDEMVIHNAVNELFNLARGVESRPFFMTISLTHPHDPYVTQQHYWNLYDDESIDDPNVGFVPLENRDPHSRSLFYHYSQDKADVNKEAIKNARRGYYGMISYVDDLFNRVLDTLKTTGMDDNTVVIFTSDHGDMVGERGMWFKKTLFEPAIKIPLVLYDPRVSQTTPKTIDKKIAKTKAKPTGSKTTGKETTEKVTTEKVSKGKVSTPVSLVDLFPTLIALAGGNAEEIPTEHDGHNLLPLIENDKPSQPVFVEHIDGGTIAPRVMIRDDKWKLVYSRAYPAQLYNLVDDPDELANLAASSEYSSVLQRLSDLADNTWNLEALVGQIAASQAARRVVDAALGSGRIESWDFEQHSLKNTRYARRGDVFPDLERRSYVPYRAKN